MGQDDVREGVEAMRKGEMMTSAMNIETREPRTRREITSRMYGDGVKSVNYGVSRVHVDKLIGMSQKSGAQGTRVCRR